MKILVIGSGGREHALCWKLSQSKKCKKLYCAPGNAGTAKIAENVPISVQQVKDLLAFAKKEKIDLTVVGPEAPLCAGIVDLFEKEGLLILGPNKKAAQLEGSKVFTKRLLEKYQLPTARARIFQSCLEARRYSQKLGEPQVIKANGLAAGKGVIIVEHPQAASSAIYDMMERKIFGPAGEEILIEEVLKGKEVSVHVLVNGTNYLILPMARDYKRLIEGDQGPNTGGMGASSSSLLSDVELEQLEIHLLRPLLRAFQKEEIDYRGMLYLGLMMTAEGPKVLELNCRFGDPETQVMMPLIQDDLVEIFEALLHGKIDQRKIHLQASSAISVVMAMSGYPGDYRIGVVVDDEKGIQDESEIMVFHAGTELQENKVVTAGGRVFAVTGWGPDLKQVSEKVYRKIRAIKLEGACYRSDIAGEFI